MRHLEPLRNYSALTSKLSAGLITSTAAAFRKTRLGYDWVDKGMRNCLINFARRTGGWFVCAAVFAFPAWALNPAYLITQYAHSMWGSDAGIAAVRRIRQSPDGYLWLATGAGLLRFDGVRFSPFNFGSEEGLESSAIQDLVIDPDGSMWIATTLGGRVFRYQAGKLHTYTSKDGLPPNEIMCLYRDSGGTLWVGTRGGGVARMVHGRFERVPLAIPAGVINSFLEGPDHSLWISTFGYGVFRLQNGILTSFTVENGLPDNRVSCLYLDHSGTIWTAGWKGISSWNGMRFTADRAVNAAVSYALSLTVDLDGNFWIASPSAGLFRAHGTEVTRMDRSSGLSADTATNVFEDREGNLWVGTPGGLDRFRDGPVRTFTQREGSIPVHGPVVTDDRSGVWTASTTKITQVAGNAIRAWPISLPSVSAYTLLREPDAGLLIGSDKGAVHWTGGHSSFVPELSGLDVHALFRARDGSIWIASRNRGLLHWRTAGESRGLAPTGITDRFISSLAEDRTGAVWAGSATGGGLYRLDGRGVRHFGLEEGLRSSQIYTIFVDGQGELWIGSTVGLSWFQDGHIRTVNAQQGLPADQVFAILGDSYNRIWIAGFAGIAAVDKKSLADWAAGGRSKINPIVYQIAVGHTGFGLNIFPNAAQTADGHLWFSIADGLCEITPPDTAATHAFRFPVVVEDVNIDGAHHLEPARAEQGRVRIAPGARSIELRYTALTLSKPETLQFRYRLDGVDNDWVSADTRRLAFYNNLKPGAYNFRVAAREWGGEWQESPALVLEQLPFYYQTWWFTLLALTAAMSVVFFVYWLRVRRMAREFNVRLEERVGERTRLARELHDTLLQSFQGLIFHLQAVQDLLPAGKAKDLLEESLERADQAIAEGRSTVYELRSSATTTNDLVGAIQVLGEELATEDSGAFHVLVEGSSRNLHPIVRDEIYRITCEGLRNAFSHARASQIETEITYGERLFRLRIRDNGEGITNSILEEGRPGHYGLAGMRVRARQLGGKLEIWSRAGAGTEIELNIASAIAYGASPGRSLFRLFRRKAG